MWVHISRCIIYKYVGTHLYILYMDTHKNMMYNIVEVIQMATSEAARKAVAKYHEKLDDIKIRVPKGKKEEYKAQAAEHGLSLNAYIVQLLEADKQQDL